MSAIGSESRMTAPLGDPNYDTVLLVEDDTEIADIVAMNLNDLNLKTDRASDGVAGLDMAMNGGYSLVILDIMLPELDGLSICRQIREKDKHTPILMLTAKSDEVDRIVGLEIGADDYLTKPFSIRELMARVKALLRRAKIGVEGVSEPSKSSSSLKFADLSIDMVMRKVTKNDRVIDLTVKEFDLLVLFAQNPGRAYSRADLLSLVWGYQYEGYEHTVNTHINRLRNKIETDPANPRYLKTLWGVGYRFVEENELI